MKVRDLFIANYAEFRDGLAYVSGGFPEWWIVTQLPFETSSVLVAHIEYEQAEVELKFEFAVRLVHPSGEIDTLAMVNVNRGSRPNQPEGSPLYQMVIMPIRILFRFEGGHIFRLDDPQNQTLETVKLGVQIVKP